MIKSFRILSVIMIIISIISFIGGISFSKLAVSYQAIKVSEVRMVNGKFVTTDIGDLGANKEEKEKAETLSLVFYTLSVISIISGISFAVTATKKNNADIIQKHGLILEKQTGNYENIIVEFDDGIRKKLIAEPPLLVAKGDKGIFEFKDNLLVKFSKE